MRKQRRHVDQLLERGGADHAGLVEERVDSGLGARQRRCVRTGRLLPGRSRPALQREDRLRAGNAPGEAAEAARIAEGLDVHQHHIRAVVVLPPLEQVVRRDVGLVADRDEPRQAEAARLGRLEEREAERAALGGEADVAGRSRAGGEGGVQTRPGYRDAEAVRSDQAGAVCTHEREQSFLSLDPLPADLGEPGRDDDERAHALPQRLLGRLEDGRGRERDDGQVDRVGDLFDRPIAANPRDGLAVSVDGVRSAVEIACEDVPEELTADRAAPLRSADDGDSRRLEERPQRGDDRLVVTRVDVLAVRLGRRDRELHLELAALELARQLESGGLEHAQHGAVVGQHVGDEALDSHLGGALGQPLEQSSADPASLMLVGDGERRFGQLRVSEPDVVRQGDHMLDVVVDERAEQRTALLPVRLDHRVDESRAQRGGSRESGGTGCAWTDRRRRRPGRRRRRDRAGAVAACARHAGLRRCVPSRPSAQARSSATHCSSHPGVMPRRPRAHAPGR